jgi:hypothetical protein
MSICSTVSSGWVTSTTTTTTPAPSFTAVHIKNPSGTCLAAKANKKGNTGGRSGSGTKGGGGGGFGKQKKVMVMFPTNENDLSDVDLASTYTRYFKDEGKKLARHKRKKLVQISSTPLMFTIDEFMDAESCATQAETTETSQAFQLEFRQQVATLLFNGQSSFRDGLRFNYASSSDHCNNNNNNNNDIFFPDGLHMDTNHECIFRHVTCILYLNDVPPQYGGATCFPLARTYENDPALLASRRLLAEKISHTRSCGIVRRSGEKRETDAKLLETRVGNNFMKNPSLETAIKIQPKAGRLLLFFSRTADGKNDPRAWHGGERLLDRRVDFNNNTGETLVTEKRILTLFKQVDYGIDNPTAIQSTFEAYLSPQILEQRQSLLERA